MENISIRIHNHFANTRMAASEVTPERYLEMQDFWSLINDYVAQIMLKDSF